LNAFRASDAFSLSNYGNTEVSKLAVGWIEASHRFIEQFGERQNCLLPAGRTFIARLAQAYGTGIREAAWVPTLPALRLWQCAVNPIHERFLRR